MTSIIGVQSHINIEGINSPSDPISVGLNNGNAMLIWVSNEPSTNHDIYGQIVNSQGARLGSRFLINTFTTNRQSSPSAVLLDDGNVMVVWESLGQAQASYTDVFGQVLDADGNKVGSEFQISATITNTSQGYPSIAKLSNGNMVVVWTTTNTVMAQLLSATGAKVGSVMTVTTAAYYSSTGAAAVTALINGNFLVAWTKTITGGTTYSEIHGQLYSNAGTLVGSTFLMQDCGGCSNSLPHSLLALGNGNVVLSWKDANGFINGKIFDADGSALSAVFLAGSGNNQEKPSLVALSNNRFMIATADTNSYSHYYSGQLFDANGTKLKSNLPLAMPITDGGSSSGASAAFSIGLLNNGNIIVSFIKLINYSPYFYSQVVYGGDSLAATNTQQALTWGKGVTVVDLAPITINTNQATATARLTLSNPAAGSFTIDSYNGLSSTYDSMTGVWQATGDVNKVNKLLALTQFRPQAGFVGEATLAVSISDGVNLAISDTARLSALAIGKQSNIISSQAHINIDGNPAREPVVVGLDNGHAMLIWASSESATSADIYGQVVNSQGAKLGHRFAINTYTVEDQTNPSAVLLGDGNIMVIWESRSQAQSDLIDIFGQVIDASGNKVGEEFHVSSTPINQHKIYPALAKLSDGHVVAVWSSPLGQVIAQRLSETGAKVGSAMTVTTTVSSGLGGCAVTALTNDNFLVTWTSITGRNSEIRGQLYTNAGALLGTSFSLQACDDCISSLPHSLLALGNGNIVLSWIYGQVKAKVLDSNGNAICSSFTIGNANYYGYYQGKPSLVALSGNRFMVATAETNSYGGYYSAQVFAADGTKLGPIFPLQMALSNSIYGKIVLGTLTNGNVLAALIDSANNRLYSQVVYGGDSLAATNTQQALTWGKGVTVVDLAPITINTNQATATARLTLADPSAGSFSTGSYNGLSSTYDSLTGVWQATGDINKVNRLLAMTQFKPFTSFVGDSSITVNINDGANPAMSNTTSLSALPIGKQGNIISPQTYINDDGNFAYEPVVVGLNNDKAMLIWISSETSTSFDIYGQLVNSQGLKLGNRFLINSYTADSQTSPSAVLLNDGKVMAVWQSKGQTQANYDDIFGQIIDANGNKVGSEFQISTTIATTNQGYPVIAKLSDGNAVVVGSTYNRVIAQRLSATGTKIGSAITVTAEPYSSGAAAVVAMTNGNFLVTWTSGGQNSEIRGQFYTNAGALVGTSFTLQACGDCTNNLSHSLLTLDNGNLVLSWVDNNGLIKGQVFDTNGMAISPSFTVGSANNPPYGYQGKPSLVALSSNRFIIALATNSGSSGYYNAQVFDANGTKLGPIFPLQITLSSSAYGKIALGTLTNDNILAAFIDLANNRLYTQVVYSGDNLAATNAQQLVNYYKGNATVPLSPIAVLSPMEQASVKLTLSDPAMGSLTTPSYNSLSSTYDSNTGVWLASGKVNYLNVLLPNVQYRPSNFYAKVTLHVELSDSYNPAYNNTVRINSLSVKAAPVLIKNELTLSNGETLVITGSHLSAYDEEIAAGQLVFSVSNLLHGYFASVTDQTVAILSFTQQQVTDRQVVFVHDGTNKAPSYQMSVSNGLTSTEVLTGNVAFIPTPTASPSPHRSIEPVASASPQASLAPLVSSSVRASIETKASASPRTSTVPTASESIEPMASPSVLPIVSTSPGESLATIASTSPQVSVVPQASLSPYVSVEPIESPSPQVSFAPLVSTSSQASTKPEVSIAPQASTKPEASFIPVTSITPQESLNPRASAKPQLSSGPIVISSANRIASPLVRLFDGVKGLFSYESANPSNALVSVEEEARAEAQSAQVLGSQSYWRLLENLPGQTGLLLVTKHLWDTWTGKHAEKAAQVAQAQAAQAAEERARLADNPLAQLYYQHIESLDAKLDDAEDVKQALEEAGDNTVMKLLKLATFLTQPKGKFKPAWDVLPPDMQAALQGWAKANDNYVAAYRSDLTGFAAARNRVAEQPSVNCYKMAATALFTNEQVQPRTLFWQPRTMISQARVDLLAENITSNPSLKLCQ